jgi:hypothetical protein
VWATWKGGSVNATNAPFVLYDGGTVQQITRVNQKVAPTGLVADGASWKLLGTVTVTSGRLIVKLTNAANGRVIADAVRIQRLVSSTPTPTLPPPPLTAPTVSTSPTMSHKSPPINDYTALATYHPADFTPEQQLLADAVDLIDGASSALSDGGESQQLAADELALEALSGPILT